MKWRKWLYGLAGGIVGGVASAGSAWLGTAVANSAGADVPVMNWKTLGIVLMTNAIVSAFLFLKQSPLPSLNGDSDPAAFTRSVVLLGASVGLMFGMVGCASPALSKGMVRTAVSTGVAFGVLKDPTAIPYLRAATPVICAAAANTNLSPAAVIAALEGSDATQFKTAEAVIIMNGALSIYSAVWAEYGGRVSNFPLLQAYLEGTCEGLTLGLPTTKVSPVIADGNWVKPHIQ